jgi:hypothetical protein
MVSFKYRAVVAGALFFSACAQPGAESNTAAAAQSSTFVYAPAVGKPVRETMRRYEEMSIPGSPIRESEEWTMEWDAVTTRESNLYKRSLKLVGLKIAANGQEVLRGDEVKANQVVLEVLTDKDANVVDVRGTDQFSAAIVGLGAPEAQPVLRRIFSPERLKALAVLRTVELRSDFVGRPSQVGSQWMASDPNGGPTREIRVVAEEACGSARCAKVTRKFDVDKNALYQEVSARVAEYVKSQGGDPSQIKVSGMDLKLQDSISLDPASMDCHGARFIQDATIRVAGPNGELPVAFKQRRETDYAY